MKVPDSLRSEDERVELHVACAASGLKAARRGTDPELLQTAIRALLLARGEQRKILLEWEALLKKEDDALMHELPS